MDENSKIVIIGAGQAATQAANPLRQLGFVGAIDIFGNEELAPYQRPPLSKAYLMGEMALERLQFRAEEQWQKSAITLHLNDEVVAIDRDKKTIKSQNGENFAYDKLIIATGSRPRKIVCEGSNLENIHYLRSLKDSVQLGAAIKAAKSIAIVGAGYIGLEVAAVARKSGLDVTVIEAAPRVLARVACPQISEFYTKLHIDAGVKILTGASVQGFIGNDKVEGVLLADGRKIDCDVALVGIGALANDELASACGLVTSGGINTDENAMASDKDIYACGDCANREVDLYGVRMRLESVHNAIEQAKMAAAHIMGQVGPRLEAPWFWSDQYDVKLQIAGLWNSATKHIIRGDINSKKFAIFHLDDENRLLAVDGINSAAEFLVSKSLILAKARLNPEIIADVTISAKELATLVSL